MTPKVKAGNLKEIVLLVKLIEADHEPYSYFNGSQSRNKKMKEEILIKYPLGIFLASENSHWEKRCVQINGGRESLIPNSPQPAPPVTYWSSTSGTGTTYTGPYYNNTSNTIQGWTNFTPNDPSWVIREEEKVSGLLLSIYSPEEIRKRIGRCNKEKEFRKVLKKEISFYEKEEKTLISALIKDLPDYIHEVIIQEVLYTIKNNYLWANRSLESIAIPVDLLFARAFPFGPPLGLFNEEDLEERKINNLDVSLLYAIK